MKLNSILVQNDNLFIGDHLLIYFNELYDEIPNKFSGSLKIKFDKVLNILDSDKDYKRITTTYFTDSRGYNYPTKVVYKNDVSEILLAITNEEDYNSEKEATYFVICYLEKSKEIKEFMDLPYAYPKSYSKKINIIKSDRGNLYLDSMDFPETNIVISDNYNDSFYPVHESISELLIKDISGLHLFHGEPGCGKTSYIKYLIQSASKQIIYCPPALMESLSSPEFITFLMRYPKSILVVEDAEKILRSREFGSTSAISNLLNLSDGLLGDLMQMQVVATFNCNLSDIDDALLRKGRLLSKYEFGKLNKDKAFKIINRLDPTIKNISEDLTLADVYYYGSASYKESKRKLGI